MKLIECVPNFSEGRDARVLRAIRDRIAAVPGVSVLHTTADASHNRSVITFVAPADAMVEAALAAVRAARDNIDLTRHAGVHPRIGAADVIPFIPLDGATMQDCIEVARETGLRVGRELGIPVYLYEQAATRASRRNLADVRRGGFESLRDIIATDSDRIPDFGPREVHPTAGAVAIGARPFLVAFNVYIGPASNLPAARSIARAVRESSGGLPAVKALGLEVDGQAQVSLNLVDLARTGLATAYAAVERETRARGLDVVWSEIIGLVPESVADDAASRALRLRDDIGSHVLERALLEKRTGQTLSEYVSSVGDSDPFPGGGSVAAIAAALASALVAMVAGVTTGRERYRSVEAAMSELHSRARLLASEMQALAYRDAAAYARVVDARRLPQDDAHAMHRREDAIRSALLDAIAVPLSVARSAALVSQLALDAATRGNSNAVTDAGVAALLASAACTAAGYNVRINAGSLRRPAEADAAVTEAISLARSAAATAREVSEVVEAALSRNGP